MNIDVDVNIDMNTVLIIFISFSYYLSYLPLSYIRDVVDGRLVNRARNVLERYNA